MLRNHNNVLQVMVKGNFEICKPVLFVYKRMSIVPQISLIPFHQFNVNIKTLFAKGLYETVACLPFCNR